jgi:hypothetical protein
MRLKQWGYLTRNENKVFSWTEIAKERYKKFSEDYDYLERPADGNDKHFISNLELVSQLIALFPQFNERINVPTIGRQMNDRGFEKLRMGKKRISTYVISKRSKILERVQDQNESWLQFEDQTPRYAELKRLV